MKRRSPFGRSEAVTPATGRRLDYFRLHHETLEDRKMLTAYINEIYIDPPGGGGDTAWEYIELRTDSAPYSLADHYLIQVENEPNNPGEVETIFDLSTLSFGSNGFLVLRQKNLSGELYDVDPNASDYVNTGVGAGWGSGVTSSLPVEDIGNDGKMENSGGTFMLIHNVSGSAPFLGQDLDVDDNGLDVAAGAAGWDIVDSIGINAEADDPGSGAILYSPINFGTGPIGAGQVPAGAAYVDVLTMYGWDEIEYVGRWGDSTGKTPADEDDWFVANLTDDAGSGYTAGSPVDFRQSGDPHGFGNQTVVETSHGVAYGTNLTATLGTTNFQNATVTGRRLFYNNSIWDNAGYGFTNATAIAPDKVAYIPTGANTSSFANMSSYTKGINGIMVEVTNPNKTLTASDFTVRMSGQEFAANNTPSTWVAAPSFTVTQVPDTPTSGTDRYELVWADGAIVNRYVYVVVEGADALGGFNVDTGLPTSDYFFFGSMIGDAGSPEFYPNVDNTDQVQVRNNGGQPALQNNPYDFNRDAIVDPTDEIIARNNQTAMPWLALTAPPAAPEAPPSGSADDGSASAVAAALAAPTAPAATPEWVSVRLAKADASGSVATVLGLQLAQSDRPGGLADRNGDIDEVVDVGVDDELLDALAGDLST